jgi:hypothetical protein
VRLQVSFGEETARIFESVDRRGRSMKTGWHLYPFWRISTFYCGLPSALLALISVVMVATLQGLATAIQNAVAAAELALAT